VAVTTLDVLRRSAGASIGYGILFGVALPFTCLLGVPTTAILLALIGRQLDGVLTGGHRERDEKWKGALFVFLFVVVVVFASLSGNSAASLLFPTMASDIRSLLGVVPALALSFAILLPYGFVPLILRDQGVPSGIGGHAFVVSAQAVSRLPMHRQVSLVLSALATQAIPYAVFVFMEGSATFVVAIGACLLGYAVLVPLATAHYVAAYASVREGLEGDPFEDDPVAVPPALRAAGVSALLSALVLAFLVAEAVLVPLPMTAPPVPDEPLRPVPGVQPIPIGDGQVLVRSAGSGVTVAARDGGGAGFVSSGCGEVGRVAVTEGPEGVYRVVAPCEHAGGTVEMRVDGRGVRLDDSFHDRIGARMGAVVYTLFTAILILWALSFGGPWRAFQRVRYLRSLAGTDRLDQAPGLRALEGTLHASAGVQVAAGRFTAEGAAQVSGGPLRVTLPGEGPALGTQTEVLADGASVAVVGHFESLISGGLREGPAPWPSDGLLVPGGRREAAERLSRSAGRRLAMLFVAVTAAQGVASVVVVLGW